MDKVIVPAQFPEQYPAKIAFVGEAPGEVEEAKGVPLIGPAGKLFNKGLHDAGIARRECLVTNVLDFRVPKNNVEAICVTREKAREGCPEEWRPWIDQPLAAGKHLPWEIAGPALTRLAEEIKRSGANLVVPMGGLAVWAMMALPASGSIKKMRGTVAMGELVPVKVVPTYHPAFVLRAFQAYPIFWADLLKARRECLTPEMPANDFGPFTKVERAEQVEELLSQLVPPVAVDIETVRYCSIDCIGFSDGKLTFTVPVFDHLTYAPYWSRDDEVMVRRAVCRWLESKTPKIFQNGSYDCQVLWEAWRVKVYGYAHDTRLLSHSLWPELPKDLATLAALHTNLPAWKPIKSKKQKKDD